MKHWASMPWSLVRILLVNLNQTQVTRMMRKQMCATLHIKNAGKSTAGRETAAGSLKSIFVNCLCSVRTLYNNPVIEKLQPWGGSWCDGVYRKNWWFIGKVQVVHLVANICVDQVSFVSHRLYLCSGLFQLFGLGWDVKRKKATGRRTLVGGFQTIVEL